MNNNRKFPTKLEIVQGSYLCQFSVIENKLATLYENQQTIYDLCLHIKSEIESLKEG